MAKSAYPGGQDLHAFLAACNLTLDAKLGVFLDEAVAAAIAGFEREAGRAMLAGAAPLRRFDPPTGPGRVLFVPDLATVTSVVYQPTGGTAETLVEDEDYELEPYDAAAQGLPITRV